VYGLDDFVTGVVDMRRAWSFFCIALLSAVIILPLAAQEEGGGEEGDEAPPVMPPPIESEWEDYSPSRYSKGDKTFIVTLGPIFPTVFTGAIDDMGIGLNVGGTGSLAYNYFLSPHLFLGGELGGMFARTRGENMLFIVPFGPRFGYQFLAGRFEFPLSIMIGGAGQKVLDKSYFGLIIKFGTAAFWRFNPDWSFGLNCNWWMLPQWPENGSDALGNFLELTLSARYHF
jgi:hypothetical protein